MNRNLHHPLPSCIDKMLNDTDVENRREYRVIMITVPLILFLSCLLFHLWSSSLWVFENFVFYSLIGKPTSLFQFQELSMSNTTRTSFCLFLFPTTTLISTPTSSLRSTTSSSRTHPYTSTLTSMTINDPVVSHTHILQTSRLLFTSLSFGIPFLRST